MEQCNFLGVLFPALTPVAKSSVMQPSKRAAYQKYISSSEWRKKRAAILRLRGKKWEKCLTTFARFEVHHKNYETFGAEKPADLQVLCQSCHREADFQRQVEQQYEFERKCEDTRHENARETYLDKKYGIYRDSSMNQEFDDWLERKRWDQWASSSYPDENSTTW